MTVVEDGVRRPPGQLRAATPADLDAILELNRQWQHVTSSLDAATLASLHAEADVHWLVESADGLLAFALAFREGAAYGSANYRWFAARYETFLYVDRIVVASRYQGLGVGARLYDALIARARSAGLPRVVCEIDLVPRNAASDAFHAHYGFVEVGTQWLGGGVKQVSLRSLDLGALAGAKERGGSLAATRGS